MKLLKFLCLFAGIGTALVACNKADDELPVQTDQKHYPVSVTRTASYHADTLRSVYSYNSQNQIFREDVLKNRKLQGYNLFYYTDSGKLRLKTYHDAAGLLKEKDEIGFTASTGDITLMHSYVDASGQGTLHHYRVHAFDASGKILSWTDFTPQANVISRREYSYPASGKVVSPGYDQNQRLLSTSEITFDTFQHPFVNTALNVVTFPGNEVDQVEKDSAGQQISAYTNYLIYDEAGFPEKLVQVHTNGVTKTETYVYKKE